MQPLLQFVPNSRTWFGKTTQSAPLFLLPSMDSILPFFVLSGILCQDTLRYHITAAFYASTLLSHHSFALQQTAGEHKEAMNYAVLTHLLAVISLPTRVRRMNGRQMGMSLPCSFPCSYCSSSLTAKKAFSTSYSENR